MNKITPPDLQNSHSQALNLLRFPLAVVILIVHVFGRKPAGFSDSDLPIFNLVKSFIESFLHWQSVPIYFFISGFVFFIGLQKWDNGKWIKKLQNRKKSLLIPYIIWNTLSFLPLIINNTGELDIKSILSCYWAYNGEITGISPTGMPINYPLWFLRDLMLIILFTPFLYRLLKKNGKIVLSLFAILWLFKYFTGIKFYIPTEAMFFFSFGAYMSINGKDMIAEFRKFSKISVFGFILLGLVSMCLYNSYPQIFKILKALLIIFGLFFAYNTSVYLLQKGYCKVNNFLSSASFFIYVSHTLVFYRVSALLTKLLSPDSDLSWLFLYIMNVVLTSLILVSVFYLMSRYTPKFLSIIAGRKV